jgi:signal transduction histidine kinase/HAMP domain-containing protein
VNLFSSLRVRLVALVLLAVALSLTAAELLHFTGLWGGILVGFTALAAAWLGGEFFVTQKLKPIKNAAQKLAQGDLSSRTGLHDDRSELGELARSLDTTAESLQRQTDERQSHESELLNRAHQQTVIAALGQFALVAPDASTLLNQAVMLVCQTLEVEYCAVWELQPDGKEFRLLAGMGWKEGAVGHETLLSGNASQAGYTLVSGEPVVVADSREERRFHPATFMQEHGVISGVTVSIKGHNRPFGVLGAHTSQRRAFSEEEVHFLFSTATLLAMAIDRQRTEPEIQKLAAFAKYNPNPILEFSSEGNLVYFNDAAQNLAALLGEPGPGAFLPSNAEGIVQTCLVTGMKRVNVETRPGARILSWSFNPIMDSQVVHCYVEDVTERASLEDQLRQAQKMESVGQLAAGVAHDFNNILTIIQGHSGLLMSRQSLSPAMTTSVQAISFAAERATSLTRQLLMFSRKQVMQPKALDLKDVVANMSKMLQRLIGETVKLTCNSGPQVPPIRGDAGMMEQILMNLAVNARDAMPRGGQLLVNTEHVQVDEAYARRHADAYAGPFVRLTVQDTGTGMDVATMRRIFEPFFTTKEAGKGTGLGLATVYGIVKQHSGWIEVASEPGTGTAFRIYFPASSRQLEEHTEFFAPTTQVRGGGETILVVEDEPVLRDLAQVILQDCGYRVVQAASGVEALTVWQQQHGNIDLLLTDMIMPDGLSGTDLAESLIGHKPGLKVIFTSGYNVEDLGGDFLRKNGSHFLQKPYTRITLAQAVRACLDE